MNVRPIRSKTAAAQAEMDTQSILIHWKERIRAGLIYWTYDVLSG